MKRFIVVLLAVLLISGSALAEEIDFSGMSLSELLALHEKLDAAIQEEFDCALDPSSMYQGVYVVGKDIEAGNYLFTSISKTFFMCHLYEDVEHKQAHDGGQHETITQIGDTLSLTLEDGMVLVVDQGVAAIKAIEKPEWAP